jgi:integrase
MRFQENHLTPYRRHAPGCAYGKEPELRSELKKCECPLWVHGRIRGELYRKSLGTRSLQKAMQKIAEKLNAKEPETEPESAPKTKITIADAIQEYLRYCEHNKRVKASTLTSYQGTFGAFQEFCQRRLYVRLDQLTLRVLEHFQAERRVTPKTIAKEFRHLKGFCARAVKLGHIPTNYAQEVKLPKTDDVSTLPFREAEARAILEACGRLGVETAPCGGYASYSAERLDEDRRYAKALVLVLLTTGLRISDAVNLQRSKVSLDRKGHTRLHIRTEKTGVRVTLRLPNATVQALRNLPEASHDLYFWKGGSDEHLDIACKRARRVLARLGKLAGVLDVRPHRFRDTWAKTALLNGTSMHTVQLVLGHKSIRTTERHYVPYVEEYQENIDAATDIVAARLIA